MATDYFTRAEFRTFAKDPAGAGQRYDDTDIDAAQAEVIDVLEAWAQSSWANVVAALGATGAMTSGSAVLTVSTGSFVVGDVGKPVSVQGAGPGGADLVTTVQAFTSATQVTLAAAAGTTVAGAVVRIAADTDGKAVAYRAQTDRFNGGIDSATLSRVPAVSLSSIAFDSVALSADAYVLRSSSGIIAFDNAINAGVDVLVASYRYGHGSTPWSIKRPAMKAAKVLLDDQEGRGSIPENVEEYTVEGTNFVFRREPGGKEPWPWSREASEAVRSYWSRYKPRTVGARV